MAKQKPTLDEALGQLKDVQDAYEKLIRQNAEKRTVAVSAAHADACRAALAQKRYAADVVTAVRANLPIPKKP